MLFNEALDVAQCSLAKTMVVRQCDGSQPEFHLKIITGDVDVRRLAVFAAVKMETIRPDAQNRRHRRMVPVVGELSNDWCARARHCILPLRTARVHHPGVMRTLAALFLAAVLTLAARTVHGAERWLKAGDVVALVGGEDMVALAEEGWLETLVTWAQPKDRIRWRSLAWEGDTVFEQRRDLNYPTLETQLDRMGATVVICQFGKMESFAGKEGVAAFTEAYGKLLARLSGEKKRRIALVLPPRFGAPPKGVPDLTARNGEFIAYMNVIRMLAEKNGAAFLEAEVPDLPEVPTDGLRPQVSHEVSRYRTRDGVHLDKQEQFAAAITILSDFDPTLDWAYVMGSKREMAFLELLRTAIRAKNRLWFHYTRPQNWAFLAGNRTNQPSSRDHLDPSKRWFPEEMEQWLPLIEAKEKEIWALAAAR